MERKGNAKLIKNCVAILVTAGLRFADQNIRRSKSEKKTRWKISQQWRKVLEILDCYDLRNDPGGLSLTNKALCHLSCLNRFFVRGAFIQNLEQQRGSF